MHPRIQRYFPVFPDGNIQSDFQFLPLLLFFSDMLCSANIRYNIHTEDRYAKWFLLSKCPIHRLCLHGAILLVHQIYLLSISIKMHYFFLIRWIYIFFQLFVCRFRIPICCPCGLFPCCTPSFCSVLSAFATRTIGYSMILPDNRFYSYQKSHHLHHLQYRQNHTDTDFPAPLQSLPKLPETESKTLRIRSIL